MCFTLKNGSMIYSQSVYTLRNIAMVILLQRFVHSSRIDAIAVYY
jgi:hypothetical protein